MKISAPRVRPHVSGDTLDFGAPLLWTVDGVLSEAECGALIARIEHEGCTPAPITTAAGFVHRPDIRNNDRVIVDDAALAATLFERVLPTLPVMNGGVA